MDPEHDSDAPLAEQEALAEPVIEARAQLVIPKRGKVIAEDGTCGIAIIRPCVSRGRRIRGLPPIYEASMLERHASVFTNWPMFMDHVPPELAKVMAKHGRSVKELGGRVVESRWDPDHTREDDSDYGYQRGGVVGRALPTPVVASMVSNDPELLHTSINAWPTGGRPGTAYGQRGMLIEGIRRTPMGSVDWVVRGGAGGRVLTEDEQRVVTLAESYYDAEQMAGIDLSKLSPEDLRAKIAESAPHLASVLREDTSGGNGGGDRPAPTQAPPAPTTGSPLTPERVQEMIAESERKYEKRLAEREQEIRDEAESAIRLAEENRALIATAHALIESSELPATWKGDLKRRYSILPSGDPAPAIQLVEAVEDGAEPKSREDVLKEAVENDLKHAANLIAEAKGRPRVQGQGAGSGDTSNSGDTRPNQEGEKPYWLTEFEAMGVVEGASEDERNASIGRLREAVHG